jgi:hypothetical protein
MAIDQLTHFIDEQQLSNDDLQAAIEYIERLLDKRKWDDIWQRPEAIALARRLAEESREDELEDGGFDCL